MDTNIAAYIEVNVICMIISAIMFFLINQNRTVSFQIKRVIAICLWVLCIADIAAISLRGQMFNGARALIQISNLLYDLMVSVLPFIWMIFVLSRIGYKPKKWFWVAICLPLVACVVIVAINPFTNFLFSINEKNEYVRGAGIIVNWILSWFYIALSGVFAGIAIARAKSHAKQLEYAPLLYFLAFPIIGAVGQMIFYGITAIQVGITLMVVLMTLKDQSDQITKDQLTGINNRNALNDYVDYLIRRPSKRDMLIAMIDINAFKNINDKFGHEVGDIALADAGDILKEVTAKHKREMFLCRYGGDEFVIVSRNADESMVAEIKEQIKSSSNKYNSSSHKPFKIEFSVGCYVGGFTSQEAFSNALQTADAYMYEDKKSYYKNNNE